MIFSGKHWSGHGQLAKSCSEQVARIKRIPNEAGLQVASPDEARAILELKGADTVGF